MNQELLSSLTYFAMLTVHANMWTKHHKSTHKCFVGRADVFHMLPDSVQRSNTFREFLLLCRQLGFVGRSEAPKHKFIVMGSWCEYMAHLHTEAVDEAEAREKWEHAFTKSQREGLYVVIADCTKEPWMLPHWKQEDDGSDFLHYSGGYNYGDY